MSRFFILEKGEPVQADAMAPAVWRKRNPDQVIVSRTQVGHMRISTVFVGMDSNVENAAGSAEEAELPRLYETCWFGTKDGDDHIQSYGNRAEALAGHKQEVCPRGRSRKRSKIPGWPPGWPQRLS